MKYLFVVLMLFVGTAQAVVVAKSSITQSEYEITADDCSALNDITRATTMMRDEGDSIDTVKARIKASKKAGTKEFNALLPTVMRIVNDIYDTSRPKRTPTLEAEEVYMRCMDHVYAGTDF